MGAVFDSQNSRKKIHVFKFQYLKNQFILHKTVPSPFCF